MEYLHAQDSGKGYFAGEDDICDQEGCSDVATVTLRLKQEFCRNGHASDPYEHDTRPLVRKFCARHSTRGDCGLEDADSNYEIIAGDRTQPKVEDVKESGRVNVTVASLDELPQAISDARNAVKQN
jgi:hypothetical protein